MTKRGKNAMKIGEKFSGKNYDTHSHINVKKKYYYNKIFEINVTTSRILCLRMRREVIDRHRVYSVCLSGDHIRMF